MVFKCAKGLFSRLGPAVLEKKREMLKLQQESNGLKVLGWRTILRMVKATRSPFPQGARRPKENSYKLLGAYKC